MRDSDICVSAIASANGIKIGRYSKNTELLRELGLGDALVYKGLAVRIGDEFAVFYRDGLVGEDFRRVLAHELGHIFLGHLLPGAKSSGNMEKEADAFAECLLSGGSGSIPQSRPTPCQLPLHKGAFECAGEPEPVKGSG